MSDIYRELSATLSSISLVWGVVALVITALVLWQQIIAKYPLPPGPRKRLFFGNLFDLPTSFQWKNFARWSKEYGSDILHLSIPGKNIIVINSTKIAHDLLERRSAKYSSRPNSTMLNDLVGWNWLFSSMAYGEPWRERRRMFSRHFSTNNSLHMERELEFVQQLLLQALNNPTSLLQLLQHTTGGITLSLAYGIPIKPLDDPYVQLAEEALAGLTAAAIPGAFLVDFFPFLKYIPEWVPGAGFQKKAREWRKLQDDLRNKPFYETLYNVEKGTARPSFVSLAVDLVNNSNVTNNLVKDVAGNFFVGGAETTITALETLFLAILLHPETQRKAHDELDRVVGRGRLPEFGDQDDLPYLMAVIKESVRWNPVLPLAVPRETLEDDVYNGYYIPNRSIVFGNIWAMFHDERDYPNPSEFNPERFLKDGELNEDIPDPLNVFFGFGRRECPGKHIGLSSIWLITASILSVFDVTKPIGEDGNVIEPSGEYRSSITSHPVPYQTLLKPRSKEAERLVRAIAEAAP